MYIEAVDHEGAGGGLGSQLAHPVEIDEEAEEDLVCGGAVLEDAEEV